MKLKGRSIFLCSTYLFCFAYISTFRKGYENYEHSHLEKAVFTLLFKGCLIICVPYTNLCYGPIW